jgi:hypothetical protein
VVAFRVGAFAVAFDAEAVSTFPVSADLAVLLAEV